MRKADLVVVKAPSIEFDRLKSKYPDKPIEDVVISLIREKCFPRTSQASSGAVT
jgi:hypothetical protein